jgi:2-aminophenol/2-amino-5-chlorophenol 1,6-dioxygenase alpha subunit
MSVVSAFLVPGNPLPYLNPNNPPWKPLADAYKAAGAALQASKPDVILVYSTQWIAVLDELWQTRKRVDGLHVDENWYEYGDLPFDMKIDVDLASACVEGSKAIGISSKGVDYDAFPIDTGTIVAAGFLNSGNVLPLVIAANNLYHDPATTAKLAQMAVEKAAEQKKRVAVVGVGGLSGTIFRKKIDIAKDHIASDADDAANKAMLALLEKGDKAALDAAIPGYAKGARVDMGFKHLSWIMGAIGDHYAGAKVHAYGPTYGSGAAVVEFKLK